MTLASGPHLGRRVHLTDELGAAAATIDPGTLTVAEVDELLEVAGVHDGRLPERMAPVHALVSALPRPVAERLLAGVLKLVYRG